MHVKRELGDEQNQEKYCGHGDDEFGCDRTLLVRAHSLCNQA
ncbi:hypothetical protein [Kibdelosporangium philippinense]|nr:hypothetical protein [Kibdelosporangium philippinense]